MTDDTRSIIADISRIDCTHPLRKDLEIMTPLPECEADATPTGPVCPVCAVPLARLSAYPRAYVCERPVAHGLAYGDAILFYGWELMAKPVSAELARELLMVLPARLGGAS